MGQNIVNCVTWLWGGWLSAHPLLFYLLSSHPLLFSCFCHLLFLSSVSISPLAPPPPHSPGKPSFCSIPSLLASSPLIVYFSPFVYPLNFYLHTSVLYTFPLRLSSPAPWLSTQTDRTWVRPLAFYPSISLMRDWHILENPLYPNQWGLTYII